ncbi:hypothetical protein KDD93_08255 [Campylobacter sp. faydin G-24]|uniref:Lipoprotein n=1 Tax=Campylobacter anatolicus TaxID=2829105 RepID=A0ABS5HJV5_9BACT|nr:hypothetical protein [Campylobacter anatolicus]MBR8464554.1 hypothetical protein [Campylobacter anatolicus]
MRNFILFTLAIFVFIGCSHNTPAPKSQSKPVVQKLIKSHIKGVITQLTYQDARYCYTIVSNDTSNAKLSSAKFCSDRYYHDKGDLVYATFIGDRLESMLLIRDGGLRSNVVKPTLKKKNIKTKIKVPKEEKINF